MESKARPRGRWRLADWHHKYCRQDACAKRFCRDHRRVFWECQDFEWERSVNYFGGDGECIECHRAREMGRLEREMGLPKAS